MHSDFVCAYHLTYTNIKMNYFNSTKLRARLLTSQAQFSSLYLWSNLQVVILQRNHHPFHLFAVRIKC